jgi:hypothetical protein
MIDARKCAPLGQRARAKLRIVGELVRIDFTTTGVSVCTS